MGVELGCTATLEVLCVPQRCLFRPLEHVEAVALKSKAKKGAPRSQTSGGWHRLALRGGHGCTRRITDQQRASIIAVAGARPETVGARRCLRCGRSAQFRRWKRASWPPNSSSPCSP